ncbi:protein phosphatase inhibitor 2, putative [Cryptosporidium muris RN66]|uniref:Protein phosphatase inhibitor 2, putative n=1 Tax=Cryptosporidium muris (strain RN66) TaxID=441375 RepID=B6AAM4_CRYMR|nr:protein phosphatase inhibitor 2, putative [Cryptosporidium muris RN66]EEA05426.1 protein phosphatase inhibitor 2, putative [Cryptosporidium muris RN66]|eukprot:XP_002139775.1 protein phosphatase inhibitor 2 [Cryptosporidium muris RN66]
MQRELKVKKKDCDEVDKPPPKSVWWDEETIALHNQERGTRIVINEPDTPYNGSLSISEDESDNSIRDVRHINPQDLCSKLNEYVEQMKNDEYNIRSPRETKNHDFEQKRKSHYNEFLIAKLIGRDISDDSSDGNTT